MSFLETIRTSPPSPITLFRGSDIVSKGWEELRAGITAVSSQGSGNLAPTVQTLQTIKKYRSWVYPCVNLISRKVSEVPYYLYKDVGSKKNKEELDRIHDHPMLTLLKHPNNFLSGRQFKEVIQMYLDLCGFAVAKIVKRASGQPCELHPMLPYELVEVVLGVDPDDVIKGFLFAPLQNRAKLEFIPYSDCLYFHYPHPRNPYMPYSPIEAAAHVTDLDLYLQVYQKDFFHNSARPDFVIIPDRQITEPTAHRMQEGWVARHRGPGKQFKPAVLSESVKFQQISATAKDFEFIGLASYTRDHILATYNVPEAMLGLFQSFNKASSITAETIFVNNSINKRLDLWEDVINHQLVPLYRSLEGHEVEHASALPRDQEWELTEAQGKISTGLLTLNEWRKREGLPAYDGKLCDVPWMNGAPIPGCNAEADRIWKESQAPPPNLIPPGTPTDTGGELPPGQAAAPETASNAPSAQGAMGQLGGRPELPATPLSTLVAQSFRASKPALSSLLNAARGKRGGLRALLENNKDMHSFGSMLNADNVDTSMRKLLMKGIRSHIEETFLDNDIDRLMFIPHEEMLEQLLPFEADLIEQSRAFYTTKGIELADIVGKQFAEIVIKGDDGINDIAGEDLKEEYKRQSEAFATKAVEIGYQTGFLLVQKAAGSGRQPDPFEQASVQAAGKFLDRSADLRVKATKKALKDILREGLEAGFDSSEISDQIRQRFDWIGKSRAEMIARTELSAATWAGQDAAYEQINKDAGKIVVKEADFWTSLDERVCKQCDGLQGDPIKDYETGIEHISMPPHPNCRCAGRPVLAKSTT